MPLEMTQDAIDTIREVGAQRDNMIPMPGFSVINQRPPSLFDQLRGQPWDVRYSAYLAWFIMNVSWRNLGRWCLGIPYRRFVALTRRLLLAIVSFIYYHCRGYVDDTIYERRLGLCLQCDQYELRTMKALLSRKKHTRAYCVYVQHQCQCGYTRVAALDHRLRLWNFTCRPHGRFGRGDWFAADHIKRI